MNQPENQPEEISGAVIITVPTAHEGTFFGNPDSIVICGQQEDMVRHALEAGVRAVVICQADVPEEFRKDTSDTLIIASPLSAYRSARMINLALPVDRICAKDDLKVSGGTYSIQSVLDAIEANDSIAVSDGSFTIQSSKDGLHCENDSAEGTDIAVSYLRKSYENRVPFKGSVVVVGGGRDKALDLFDLAV